MNVTRLGRPTSIEAATVKAVMRLGIPTNIVSSECTIFQPAGMPGSVNWWWKPTGVLNSRNIRNASRVRESETSSPPACRGMNPYQLM